MKTKKPIALSWFAFIAIFLSSCKMVELQKDMSKLNQLGRVSGSVVIDDDLRENLLNKKHGQLLIGLYEREINVDSLVNFQVSLDGKFEFINFPGKYHIAVSYDKNGDFNAQAGERLGFSDQLIELHAEQEFEANQLHLTQVYSKEDAQFERSQSKMSSYPKLWKGYLNNGAIVGLDDIRFSRQNTSKALWKPLQFSIDTGPGIYFLEKYDPNKIPVLLVHGINGSPKDWSTLVENIDRDRYQPWLFQYESGFPLSYIGTYLYDAMSELRRVHQIEETYLIAHSMGGLVSKTYVDLSHKNNEDYLKQFVTLATPWEGQASASLGANYSPVSIPAWSDMSPGSEYLQSIWNTSLPSSLEYHLLFSYHGSSLFAPGCDDGTISLSSQLHGRAQSQAKKVAGFDVNHTEILSSEDVILQLPIY